MTLPLSKVMDLEHDLPELAPELEIVDSYFTREREQHPARRWEYAMALRAAGGKDPGRVADVGGAGSPLHLMLKPPVVTVLDPDTVTGLSLEEFRARNPEQQFDTVFCISVLEHVENEEAFLADLAAITAPYGLLFLTVDYAEDATDDRYHFHWMRERIYGLGSMRELFQRLMPLGFEMLGGRDFTWPGPQVYDYSFASLALRKEA